MKLMHKITSKRQVTIPKTVCQALSLTPGDYVEIFERDGIAHIVKMSNENLSGKFQALLTNDTFPTDDEIKESLKQRAANKFHEIDCN